MDVTIVGRHVEVNGMMERHARDKFAKLDKYFAGIQRAEVVLDVDGHGQAQTCTVEATVVLGHGTTLVGKGKGEDMMAAIDAAESKLEKQIRRFHGRLKSHRERPRPRSDGSQAPVSDEATYEQVVREMLEEGQE